MSTKTFALNVLIGHYLKMFDLDLYFDTLIGQLSSHMIKSFAYLTNSECLLCNSYHGPRLNKYDLWLEMSTKTFALNVLIGHYLKMFDLDLYFDTLIGQLSSHMIKSFAYLTNSECLLCNSYHGPRLNKYDHFLNGHWYFFQVHTHIPH